MENRERAQKIKMILMDVDGTLTDGKLTLLPDGEELKSYHVRDGLGILLARLAGLKTGIITGKTSKPLEIRAQKLKIMELHQGILDKMRVLEEILHKYGLAPEEVAYIGDDIGDLDVLKKAGLAGTVADAHPVVKKHCHFISAYPGGSGAVREFIELILEAQDKWSVIQQEVKGLTDVSDLT